MLYCYVILQAAEGAAFVFTSSGNGDRNNELRCVRLSFPQWQTAAERWQTLFANGVGCKL